MSILVEELLLCSDLILDGTIKVISLLLLGSELLLILRGNEPVLLRIELLLVLLGNKLLLVLLGVELL